MKIHPPCLITPRRLPGVKIGDAFLSIEYAARRLRDGRTQYREYLDVAGRTYSDDGIWSGTNGGSLQQGLASCLNFLYAAAEASRHPHSDNRGMYPEWVMEWAAENADEIGSMHLTLSEDRAYIQE